MLVQITAIPFIRIDVQVNDFGADPQASFKIKSIGDLYRTEVFAGQPLNFGPFIL